MLKTLIKTALCLASLSALASASPIYYLSTGQTGAQTQVDTAHTSTWLLTPNVDFSFAGGLFTMKAGGSVANDINLSIYLGSDNTGTLLSSITLTSTQFCAQAACGQFNTHPFLFTTAVPLTSGVTYFAALTSSAPNTQSQAYFIKSDTSFISDLNGTAITPSPIGQSTTATPEPTTMLLCGLVLVGIGFKKRPTA
jgi:hypothetical protein